jgi:hypothetical protein
LRAEYDAELQANYLAATPTPDAATGYSAGVMKALQGYQLPSSAAGTPDASVGSNANGLASTTASSNFWENARTGGQAAFDSSLNGLSGAQIQEMSRRAPAGSGGNTMDVKADKSRALAIEGRKHSADRAILLLQKGLDLAAPGAGLGMGTFTGDPNAIVVLNEGYAALQDAQAFGAAAQQSGNTSTVMKFDDGVGAQLPTPVQALPNTNVVFSPAAESALTALGFNPSTVMTQLQNGNGSVFTELADKLADLSAPGDLAEVGETGGAELAGGSDVAEGGDVGTPSEVGTRGARKAANGGNTSLAARMKGSGVAAPKYGPGRNLAASGGPFNRAYIKLRLRKKARELIDDEEEGAAGVQRKKLAAAAAAQIAGNQLTGLVDRVKKSWNAGDVYDLQRLGIQARRFRSSIFEVARLTYYKKSPQLARGAKLKSAQSAKVPTWRVAGE